MKQQILLIHGGDAFDTYDEYISFLKNFELDLEGLKKKGWKNSLQDKLGEGYDVIMPRMPNAFNARYSEWKIWFEKIINLLDNEVILVGHSLGGIFLVKYLAEEDFPKSVKATFLVAAPFKTPTRLSTSFL